MNKSTAQEAADEKKPTIKSWEHVKELTTKDFNEAKKLMIPFIPKGEWVSDRFCRGGRSTYEGTPQCKWRRLQTKDYKHVVRLIQYKNKMILQKAALLGAEDEQEEGGGGSGAGGCGGGGGGGGGGRAAAACQGAFQGQEKQGQEDS